MTVLGSPVTICPYEAFFATYLSHHMKVQCAPAHRQLMQILDDNTRLRAAIIAGRSMAKTTYASFGYGLKRICESYDEEIQVASRAAGKTGTATKIMRKVKRELETNELLIHDYGIRRGSEWGQECLEVVRADGHRVMFYSVGKHSSIRGSRGTVIIDDPQNSADCRSETVLMADEEWLLSDVLPVMVAGQRLIYIGTPISPISLTVTVQNLPSFAGNVFLFPAEDPIGSGNSAWPAWLTNQYLALQLADMGIDRYNAEYNCIPQVPGNPVFRREWFKAYDPESAAFERVMREIVYKVTGVDTAESKASAADETALVTVGATTGAKPDFYILDVRHNHWTSREGAAQVMQVFDFLGQHKTIAESRIKPKTNQAGDAFIEDVKDVERLHGRYVNIYPVRPEADKVTRARYVQGLCQEGRVHYDPTDKNHVWLLNQLTMLPATSSFMTTAWMRLSWR
jgi:phage terminase large subunit-like protein